MALPPPLDSYRFTTVYYYYTFDNGDVYLTTFRHYKDIDGNDFIPLPSKVQEVVTDKGSKDKMWGKAEGKRKAELEVVNPNNKTGVSKTFMVIPQRPLKGANSTFIEIFEILKTKYRESPNSFCIDYRGEERSTLNRPIRIKDYDNLQG